MSLTLILFIVFYALITFGITSLYIEKKGWAPLIGVFWLPIILLGLPILAGYIVWYTWKMHLIYS